jgi:choline dehydrogenase-like flavoprotein
MPWSADIVIVGSGVAGSLVATRLASAGLRVLILEAGPRIDRAAAVRKFQAAPIKIPECAYPDAPYAQHPTSDDPDHYFIQDGAAKFLSTYLRQVGGTTWHWLGTTPRFVPDDFRLRSRFGVGIDWPMAYEDLEPWYCEAERELGVAGLEGADPAAPRSRPFPLPPIPMSFLDHRIAAALKGTDYNVVPTPQARNSRAYDGRPTCCGSSSCIPVCPIQAKYDATSHVAKAERAGATLIAEAIVFHVDVDADGRIAGLRVRRPDGSEDRATGRIYVIAAHAIETPKLLLQSRSERAPNGIANSSDQVGRNLMDHPCQLHWGLAREALGTFRGPLSTAGIESTRAGDWRADHAAFRIQFDNHGWEWPTGAPESTVRDLVKQGLRGPALDRAIAAHTSREINIVPMVEQLPSASNRIVPDFDRRDAIGIPRPRITYNIDEYSRKALEHGRRIAAAIGNALNVTEMHHGDHVESSDHIIGTYRMGSDPRQSVVDAGLRSHDHANLYLLGSGVFPTSAVSNPTLTIAALALRAANAIQRA